MESRLNHRSLKSCRAALLCGGRSSRMGFDKAVFLCDKKGNSLLSVLAGELASIFGQVLLVTNSRAKLAAVAGLAAYPVAEDLHPALGPAGAIHSALSFWPGREIFVMACDMPMVDHRLIERLHGLMGSEGAQAAVPRRGRLAEPLYAFYGPEAGAVFQRSIKEGRLAVRDSLAALNTVYLDLKEDEPGPFQNLNTKEEAVRAGFVLPS